MATEDITVTRQRAASPGVSFSRKIIQATFKLKNGNFAGTSANTVTVSGLKTAFTMLQGSTGFKTQVRLAIYGLTQPQMNSLSTYGMPSPQQLNNEVTVEAGDEANGLSLVFRGTITVARADYNAQPDVALIVEAMDSQYLAVVPAPPLSYRGQASVATIMGNLAQLMGLQLENNGIKSKLANPYFYGSVVGQIRACARAANINFLIDTSTNTLAIWPRDGDRGQNVISIGPTTGLVGYPDFTHTGVRFTTLFTPGLIAGRKVKLTSSLQPACGTFTMLTVETNLATETPGGPWFQTVEGWRTGE